MIDRKSLARALGKQNLADWVIVERDQELAISNESYREERRTRWLLTVHADTPGGRGTTHVTIDANEGDPDRIVEQATQLARLSVGPAWATLPAAAPARVPLSDPALATGPLREAVEHIRALVAKRPGVIIDPQITFTRESVTVQTRQGFHAEWPATLARVDALIATTDHSLAIAREARRLDRLDLVTAIDEAIDDLRRISLATAPPLGPCGLVLAADALLHGEWGLWQAFVDQADATVARQGLTRYHERAPIVPDADHVPEPLDITSNGALPFGTRSAPVGDAGDAVREFALVAKGIAAGVGRTARDAALDHAEPNGGVRNLIISSGTWDGETRGRVLEIRRLRGLEIDPYTGEADLEIALGIDRTTGSPFAGGTLRLDVIDALARAKRSAKRTRRGSYEGPAAVFIERAELV